MIFRETELSGVHVVELEPQRDDRGWFARVWDPDEFAAVGLEPNVAQISLASNSRRGTLRGLHFQAEPHTEAKLVACVRGALYDVVVDLRPNSATYRQWLGIELRAGVERLLFVPEGFAHGYLTLADDTEALYLISTPYSAEAARGVRWDDPAFGIEWPSEPAVISERDRSWPDFS
jgi:dTDP-4-dehydrorhamnose 3,5-epimerase